MIHVTTASGLRRGVPPPSASPAGVGSRRSVHPFDRMLHSLAPIAAAWIVIAVSFGLIANRAVETEREK